MNNRSKQVAAVAVVLVASAMALAGRAEAPDSAYVQSFEKWKADETDDLKANWLSLAGLFWLKPGANSFGSAADNAIVFPKGPAHAGEFDLEGKEVTLKLQANSPATIEGKALSTAKLNPDTSGQVTRVEMGALHFHVIVRGERIGIRLRDTDSEASRNFKGMVFFPL